MILSDDRQKDWCDVVGDGALCFLLGVAVVGGGGGSGVKNNDDDAVVVDGSDDDDDAVVVNVDVDAVDMNHVILLRIVTHWLVKHVLLTTRSHFSKVSSLSLTLGRNCDDFAVLVFGSFLRTHSLEWKPQNYGIERFRKPIRAMRAMLRSCQIFSFQHPPLQAPSRASLSV